MGTIAVVGLLLAAGFALSGRGQSRSGSRRMPADEPQELCSFTPIRAAELSEPQRFAWLECDGRTTEDAVAMVARLRRSDAGAATRCESRWNAIRSVVEAQPDGQLESAEARADAERVERGETIPEDTASSIRSVADSRGSVQGPSDAVARRLVGPLVRALNRRRNYRSVLQDFQRAAGILADGRYGGRTYNAIRFFGGSPPLPFESPSPDASESEYRGTRGTAASPASRMSDVLARSKERAY